MSARTSRYESDTPPAETVDVVVIGGGAAGLNGALMLARSRRSVVVIDNGTPRNAPAAAMHGFIVLDGTPPPEILKRGRQQVRQYGGQIVFGEVVAAEPAAPTADGDLRFTVTLAEHWGRSVVHCPYCHGWEVRDKPIGILATSPASLHHALLFRQLTDDLVYFTNGTVLDQDARARFAARNIRTIETEVQEVVNDDGGALAGLRLVDGTFVERRVIAVATQMHARTEGLDGLKLPMEDLPDNTGRRFASAMAGTTDVPGVWVAGNATDLTAQVGASAAAGALAGSHINALLATADTDAALAAAQAENAPA
ncbi:FAD-binding protein [Streptomyces azureus]|uniref:Oxidoreductase n=1 Tax=Streptomyces azureus TaxID=146537 RepID=A0A0K8PDQ6_STRAJ|nr:FAD-binding protein [Streptomyces azureus]GAP46027.1 oxidoreductase [Streptomyces azureus]